MVRAAGPEDCRKIYELICELEAEVLPYDRFSEIYRTQLADERYECLVWEGETGVLGVLNLRFEAQLHHGGWVAEILEFAVSGMCRGQGIGSALLRQGYRGPDSGAACRSRPPVIKGAQRPIGFTSGRGSVKSISNFPRR